MPKAFDIETFLRETAYAIWDQKDVGRIYETYTHNAQVQISGQLIYSREAWLAEVLQWHAAFPDLRLFIEDLIWQQGKNGDIRTSIRCILVGTHLGDGRWGSPTGKRIAHTMIINQQVWEGRIAEEYREENEIGLLHQLGLSEFPVASVEISETLAEVQPTGEIDRLQGPLSLTQNAPTNKRRFNVEQFIQQVINELWNERLIGNVKHYYSEHYRGHGASRGEIYGQQDLQQEMLTVLAAFPDLQCHLDDFLWKGTLREGFHTSTRWTLLGTHEAPGRFGAPTGKRIRLTGITHHRIRVVSESIAPEGRILEGWTEFSENLLYRTLKLTLKEMEPPPEPSLEPSESE